MAQIATRSMNRDPQRGSLATIGRRMLNKVPEVTVYFWLIKILCTTVGETAADFLNDNLGLGLTGTSFVMGILLIVALFYQFRSRRFLHQFVGLLRKQCTAIRQIHLPAALASFVQNI